MKDFTTEERAEFIRRAQETRKRRSELKQKLYEGELTTREVLENLDEYDYIKRMKAFEYIRAHKGIGTRTTQKIMDELALPQNRRIQALKEDKMNALIEAIERKCA